MYGYDNGKASGSETTNDIQRGSVIEETSAPPTTRTANSADSSTRETEPQPIKFLISCNDDILIPSTEQIIGTCLQSHKLWRSYVAGARRFAAGQIPAASLDAFAPMHRVPGLPQNLHKKYAIKGRALWNVPSPEFHVNIPRRSTMKTCGIHLMFMEISYEGWLTKEATKKKSSSIVIEFIKPEPVNTIIYAGFFWEGLVHTCQLYDRSCRVKQCVRCYQYGHIGTQYGAPQPCGHCARGHQSIASAFKQSTIE